MIKLNNYYREKYNGLYGKVFVKEYEDKINTRYEQCIRVNTLKTKPGILKKRLEDKGFVLEKTKGFNYAFRIKKKKYSPGSTIEYLLGLYYITDASSLEPVKELNPLVGETILDACSAPGGKTTHISELMKNTGIVVGADVNRKRVKSQVFNLQRIGVKNAASIVMDVRKIKSLGMVFDKVLLDAPCTCTGVWWKDKKNANRATSRDIVKFSGIQKELLKNCCKVLKKNGALVYSTCSMEPEEGEEVISYAETIGMKIIKMKRFFPQKNNSLGFFLARMRKVKGS